MPAEKGIFLDVLPRFDMAAMGAILGSVETMFKKSGAAMGTSFGKEAEARIAALAEAERKSANVTEDAELRKTRAVHATEIAENQATLATERRVLAEARYQQLAVSTIATENSIAAAKLRVEAATIAQTRAAYAATDAALAETARNRDLAVAQGLSAKAADTHAAAVAGSALTFGKAFNAMGVASTVGVALVAGGTAKIAGNWEQMMTRIEVAGQVPAAQITDLGDRLLQLSASMGVSQNDIANASLMLSKAGLQYKDTATQVTILKSAIELAKTEGADLTTVVQQMTSSLTDFDIPAGSAANVASMLQTAASNAKRPLEDFVGSLHNVESTAAAVLDKGTGLPQLLTMMSQMASQGAGMEQVTQNLNNFLTHLNDFNSPQRSIIGSLGLDSTKLAEDLKKPNGAINVLGELRAAIAKVTTGTGENAIVHLGMAYNNPQVTDDMRRLYGQLGRNPQQRAAADMLQQAYSEGRDVTPAERKQIQTAKASGGDFAAWYLDFQKTTGPSDLVKQGLSPDLPLGMVYDKIGGTQASFRSFQGLMGDPSDPNDPRWKNTQAQFQNVSGAHPDQNGDIAGWDKVAKTWNQQLSVFKSTLEELGQALGAKFLPTLKTWLDDITAFVSFLNGHQAVLDVALHTMEAIAEIYVSQKIIGGLGALIGKFTILGGSGAGSAAKVSEELGATSTKLGTAGGAVSGFASAVGTAAALIIAAKASIDAVNNATHNETNIDPTKNPHHWWGSVFGLGADLMPWVHYPPHDSGQLPTPGPGSDGKGVGAANPQRRIGMPGYVDPNVPAADSPIVDLAPAGPGGVDPGATTPAAPVGTRNDPIYIDPQSITDGLNSSDMGADGSVGGGIASIFTEAGSGGFTLANIAKLMGTFVANLALGNPAGKLATGQFGDGGGDITSDVSAIENMTPTERIEKENTIRMQKAIRAYQKALREYAKAVRKYGPGSDQALNAEDSVLSAQDSIEQTQINQEQAGGTAAQRFADDQAKGVAATNPGKYAKDQAAAAAYNSPGTNNLSQDQVAAAIIQEGQKRGLSRDQIVAGLNVAKLESNYGANPMSHVHQNQSGTDVEGIFQQDPGYSGNHDDPHNAAGQFFDRFIQRGGLGMSPGAGAVKVQVGTYGGDYVDSQNQGPTYDRLVNSASPQAQSSNSAQANAGAQIPLTDFFGGGGSGPIFKRSPAPPVDPNASDPNKGQTAASIAAENSPEALANLARIRGGGLDPFGPGGALSAIPATGAPGGRIPVGPPAAGPGVASPLPGQIGPYPVPGSMVPGVGHGAGVGAPNAVNGINPSAAPGPGVGQPASEGVKSSQPPSGTGGGSVGMSQSAISMISAAAGAAMPGAGAAAQIALEEGNRAAKFIGQAAGIGMQGLLETFTLHGEDGAGGKGGWLGKIAGGLAGAHKSSDNVAGAMKEDKPAPALKPGDAPPGGPKQGDPNSPGPGNTINIQNQNINHGDGGAQNRDAMRQLMAYQTGP